MVPVPVRRLVLHELRACAALGRWALRRPPHVVRPDGTLIIRYGALFDLTVPPDAVASVRVERRYPEGRLVTLSEDGVLDLIVGSQTTVTVEPTRPLALHRPLGARAEARVIRFHVDAPGALAAALRQPTPPWRAAAVPTVCAERDKPVRGCLVKNGAAQKWRGSKMARLETARPAEGTGRGNRAVRAARSATGPARRWWPRRPRPPRCPRGPG